MTVRKRTSKHRAHRLTIAERNELMIGCEQGASVFESEEARQEVWELVGETLGHHPGDRPWAFWRYTTDAPGGEETQALYVEDAEEIFDAEDKLEREQLRFLAQHGLLEAHELNAILSAATSTTPDKASLERAAIVTEHRGRAA